MVKLKQFCDNCDSSYKIIYDEDCVPDDPRYCCICGQFLVDYESDAEDDEDDF